MGCDIHIYLEMRDKESGDFYYIPKFGLNEVKLEDYNNSPRQRNYDLFSTLANVRSYHNKHYISEPKGIPDDCSSYYKDDVEHYDTDGHSHSYFFVSELLEHDLMTKHKDTSFYQWLVYLSKLEGIDTKDLRVCFFFDN